MAEAKDDCFVLDKDRISHAEALAILKSRVRSVVGVEDVPVAAANGRILAASILAPRAIPAHDNSAVDGYAFQHASYDPGKGSRLAVAGVASAGHPFEGDLPPGVAIRIFTGAVMPSGLDSVAMQEDVGTERDGSNLAATLPPGLKQGANRRLAGEDSGEGDVLIEGGTRLRPQEVATAAAAGLEWVSCYRPLTVAVASTGDEILRPGETFALGKVYDANAAMLAGLIKATGARAVDLGVLPDTYDRVRLALSEASEKYDVVVLSGGASQGAEDHVVHAIDALGKRHLWQIAIKPGRPMSFGQIGNCVVLGLPGNPVAVFVCFLIYVRPVLIRLGGGMWPEPRRFPLRASFAQKKKVGRREFWRARLEQRDGLLQVNKFARDGSGLISSLRQADGLVEVTEQVEDVQIGDFVDFIPFSEMDLLSRLDVTKKMN